MIGRIAPFLGVPRTLAAPAPVEGVVAAAPAAAALVEEPSGDEL